MAGQAIIVRFFDLQPTPSVHGRLCCDGKVVVARACGWLPRTGGTDSEARVMT